MNNKQIFAALEIADHEIRLIVGEFYNTRFNVIKVERYETNGIVNSRITNPSLIVTTIKKMVDNASIKIGARIEKVLLGIPSINAKKIPVKVNVSIESTDRKISIVDIKKAVNKALMTKIESDLALINAVCFKYTTNGITSRRMPLNEIADEMIVHIDLLCADKNIAFEYVECVEKAGLSVIDISLDSFAIAKEACLFEQSVNHNIIVCKLERETTTLALIKNGRFVTCEVLPEGFGGWIGNVCDKFNLPTDIATRLTKYNCRLVNTSNFDTPIYLWTVDGKNHSLSEKELSELIKAPCSKWIEQLAMVSQPIIESGDTSFVITGEGAEIFELDELVKQSLQCSVKKYVPDTLGVRNSALSSCLGLFYAYSDLQLILNQGISSLDMNEFEKTIKYKPITADEELQPTINNNITSKLKTILFENKHKEN